jgi:hypothetical protein
MLFGRATTKSTIRKHVCESFLTRKKFCELLLRSLSSGNVDNGSTFHGFFSVPRLQSTMRQSSEKDNSTQLHPPY